MGYFIFSLVLLVCLAGGLFYLYNRIKAKATKTKVSETIYDTINQIIAKKQ